MTLVDGQASAVVDVLDRGLAYGDGLFETMALRAGRVLALDRHLARLARDARRLALAPPPRELLEEEIARLCAGREEGVLKLILTRGSGGRGYRAPPEARPRRILSLAAWPALPSSQHGLAAFLCRHPVSRNPVTAGIKHLNRLDQVLASLEWPADDYFEGLMVDTSGHLIEGTRSNVFLVRGATVITPALTHAGVAGIVREALLECAADAGYTLEIRDVALDELGTADELFVTNAVIGVRAIGSLSGTVSARYARHAAADTLAHALRAAAVIP